MKVPTDPFILFSFQIHYHDCRITNLLDLEFIFINQANHPIISVGDKANIQYCAPHHTQINAPSLVWYTTCAAVHVTLNRTQLQSGPRHLFRTGFQSRSLTVIQV